MREVTVRISAAPMEEFVDRLYKWKFSLCAQAKSFIFLPPISFLPCTLLHDLKQSDPMQRLQSR